MAASGILHHLVAPVVAVLLGAAPPPAAQDLAARIRGRLEAYRQGDAAAWAAYVAADCFCAGETREEIRRSIETRPAAVKSYFGDLVDLEVHLYGDRTAVARYRVAEFTEVDGRRQTLEQWRTETHVLEDGGWVLVAAAESPVVQDPPPIALTSEVLSSYVGRYQYVPGSVDTISLEQGRLFVAPTGEPKVELFAESETTFFAKGEPWRLVFVIGAQGRPTALAFRQNGQEFVAKRLD